MTAFRNNLVKDDPVLHAETKRPGRVKYTPEETSRKVGVVWQGTSAPQYVDVTKLRLVVDGRPEEVAPIDGVPPELAANRPRAASEGTALGALESERDKLLAEMRVLEARFKEIRTSKERIEAAIAILKPTARVEVPRVGVA